MPSYDALSNDTRTLLMNEQGHIETGLAQWQYIFLVFGSISIAWAIVFLIFMPDLPSTASFLTAEEKIIAVERVAVNRQGVKNHHFKKYQMWQAARDPKTWILFVMSVASQVPNAAGSTFTSIILETFGFDALQTQYMQMPSSGVQIASLLVSGYVCSRVPNLRCIIMIVGDVACVGAGAALVGLSDDQKWGRLVALWLCSLQSVGFAISLTMISSNIAGYTKKQLTGAALFVGYCVGNIIGPQVRNASQSRILERTLISVIDIHRERGASVHIRIHCVSRPSQAVWLLANALHSILIGYCVKTVMITALYIYMWSVNKKRDRDAASLGSEAADLEEKEAIERGMHDMTELDNKGFRYVL